MSLLAEHHAAEDFYFDFDFDFDSFLYDDVSDVNVLYDVNVLNGDVCGAFSLRSHSF